MLDREGRIFNYSGNKLSHFAAPQLPMNRAAFLKQKHFPVSEGTLRAFDLVVDETNASIYASYDRYDEAAQTARFEISRYALGTPEQGWKPVYTSMPIPGKAYYAGRGAGGKMALSGHELLFALGDYSLDRIITSSDDIAAQNPRVPFGKIHRLDLRTNTTQVISVGHRVPQGLTLTETGDILETEHGPRGGDELNIIKSGANYGWPYQSEGTRYFSFKPYLDAKSFTTKTTEPTFTWVPSIAITSIVPAGNFHPDWKGDFLVGSLKAQTIFHVKLRGQRVLLVEPIWIGHRIRDLIVDNQAIRVWTDDGTLLTLTVNSELLRQDRLSAHPAYKEKSLNPCSGCHGFQSGGNDIWAPTLKNAYGRKIGGANFQRYSQALKGREGTWDDATLAVFLKDPQAFAAGTTMINPDLTDAQIQEIVAALKRISTPPQI